MSSHYNNNKLPYPTYHKLFQVFMNPNTTHTEYSLSVSCGIRLFHFVLEIDFTTFATFGDILYLLLNLRSPRDCPSSVVPSSVASSSVRACGTSLVRWMALQCANRTASSSGQQASEALGSLLYVRCRHRSAKSTAISSKTFIFQVTHIYLFCGSVTLST